MRNKIEGLNTLKNLKKLNISFNPMTKLEGLETLTSLEEIKLQDTPLATQYAGKNAQELVTYCITSK